MTKVREAYKETEIGVIPEDWECLNLSKVSTLIDGDRGKNYPSPNELVDDGILFLSTSNIKDNKFDTSVTKFITQEKFDSLGKGKLELEDLIITLRGTLGSIMLFESDEFKTAFINAQMMIIRTNHLIDNRYLYQCMISNSIKSQIATNSTGSAQPQLTKKVVSELYIPVPHIKEQQRIAEILSTTDAHIEKLDKTIEDYQLLKKGMMKKLLTEGIGHTEFKETKIGIIPKSWDMVTLGKVFSLSSGEGLSQKDIITGKYPVYGGNGINGYHNSFLFENPQIVIGRVGAKCGCIHYTKSKAWITDNALYIKQRKKNFVDEYMLYLLELLDLNKFANQNAQPVLSGSKIYAIEVAFPCKEEQEVIGRILKSIDERIQLYLSIKDDFLLLKKSLMEKLLTGIIRVNTL